MTQANFKAEELNFDSSFKRPKFNNKPEKRYR